VENGKQKSRTSPPGEAIMERDGKKSVYLVENEVARERKIKSKMGNELKDIVISGLKAGDKVIINPPSSIKAGQKVTAKPAGAIND